MIAIVLIVLLLSPTYSIQVGTIKNVIITGMSSAILMNGSLEECLCVFFQTNGSLIALNYYGMNVSCQFFTNYSPVWQITNSSNSSFIFLNLPSTVLANTTVSEATSKHIYIFQHFKFIEVSQLNKYVTNT